MIVDSTVQLDAESPGDATSEVRPDKAPHPVLRLLARRIPLGIVSVVVASIIVYWATLILPGDAASAILGQTATPERLQALREQLGLDQPAIVAFWGWASGFLHGDFGTSLAQQRDVWDIVAPRLLNSAALVVVVAILSTIIGVAGGLLAARRPDRPFDTVVSTGALVASALPEFVVGVFVVLVFSVGAFHWFPAISALPPGTYIWQQPQKLVLPVLTLLIVVTPYVFRMVRAATIEALASDYSEVATLKGTTSRRLLVRHALPNALPPTIQVVGLNLLYLAGGIVMVETVFTYPGVGLTLVSAISSRDVPLVQFLVVLLAVFYVVVNITADVAVLLATPRKRFPR
jgi:peptide/nickel transport system permease protein